MAYRNKTYIAFDGDYRAGIPVTGCRMKLMGD